MLGLMLLVVLLFIHAPEARADIFVWVDEEGVSHFTNVPTESKYKLFIKEYERVHLSGCLMSRPELESCISEAARRYAIDRALVKAVIKAESDFDSQAVSKAGAQGLMQLMPGTAREVQCLDALDPQDNIQGGVRYLRKLLDLFGDVGLAVAAYNAGPEAVIKHRGCPPFSETKGYVSRVLKYYACFKAEKTL
ncbi:MAG: transglycosylase SLT domain-containing protein [Pseudomonadota bacterium]